ncbi:hypothetical protein V496_06248 [Pseudogymnoascus sp. VKM F-4515 (FW-2607)]|nr:hypothetical protein V496_06248 [Pseudogymnoascus sp. VKM F-4515 (FW-2607)]
MGYSSEDGCTFSVLEKARGCFDPQDGDGRSGSGSGSEYGDNDAESDGAIKTARSESGTLMMEVDEQEHLEVDEEAHAEPEEGNIRLVSPTASIRTEKLQFNKSASNMTDEDVGTMEVDEHLEVDEEADDDGRRLPFLDMGDAGGAAEAVRGEGESIGDAR